MTTEIAIPRLRPYACQGKPYKDELRAILKEIRIDLRDEARTILYQTHRFTTRDLCRLALKYELNVKATCEALEETGAISRGAWERLRRQGFRPTHALREVLAKRD